MAIKRKLFGQVGVALTLVMLLAPVLAACGGADTPTPEAVPTNTTEAATAPPEMTATEAMAAESPTTGASATGGVGMKVGLVTDVGRLNDKSFNQSSWEGVQKAATDLGLEAKAIETQDTKDYAKNIQQFIDEG